MYWGWLVSEKHFDGDYVVTISFHYTENPICNEYGVGNPVKVFKRIKRI